MLPEMGADLLLKLICCCAWDSSKRLLLGLWLTGWEKASEFCFEVWLMPGAQG